MYLPSANGSAIFRLPETLSTERIIGAGCALVTAIHGIERMGLGWGDTVVIQGAGPVGLAALAVALDYGVGKAIIIGGPEHRLRTALRFGATDHISIEELRKPQDRIEKVRQLT